MSSLTSSPSCLPLSRARNGCRKALRESLYSFTALSWQDGCWVRSVFPALACRLCSFSSVVFPPKELVGFVLFMQGVGRGLVCNSQAFPGIPVLLPPPLLTPGLCCCHSRPPSCSYLHFLGRTLSSFGLRLADLALTVFRTNGRWRRLKDTVLSGIL